MKKMAIETYISIINGLNALTKDTDWLNEYKNKTHIYGVYKKPTSVRPKDTYRLKVRG